MPTPDISKDFRLQPFGGLHVEHGGIGRLGHVAAVRARTDVEPSKLGSGVVVVCLVKELPFQVVGVPRDYRRDRDDDIPF